MDNAALTSHVAEIVSAYIAENQIRKDELPGLIRIVQATLSAMMAPVPVPIPAPPQVPAVPIKKSITPEYLICLEDGAHMKTMKRYLGTHFDMTPEQYRAKWGLPSDYPMVAPAYAELRSTLAKTSGLGRKAGEKPAPKKTKTKTS